jgi:DNA-binding HxlR family transcriptional regulator
MVVRRKNRVEDPPLNCPLSECLSVIGGAWTPNIIWYLSKQPRRFSELMADIPGVSAKVLTQRLKKLQAQAIIHRKVMPTSPPTVEYSLTELGLELKPAIYAIAEVGRKLKEIDQEGS